MSAMNQQTKHSLKTCLQVKVGTITYQEYGMRAGLFKRVKIVSGLDCGTMQHCLFLSGYSAAYLILPGGNIEEETVCGISSNNV